MKIEEVKMQNEEWKTGRGNAHRRTILISFCILHSSLLAIGCVGLTGGSKAPPAPVVPLAQTPTKDDLIYYMNKNASMLRSLDVRDLSLDITGGNQTIGVSASLYCQQPRNFRMRAKKPAVGGNAADIGSNQDEFWYWISEDKPPDLYHCSYSDLARGVRLPFPVEPEWVMEALGMKRYDPARLENFSVEVKGRTIELIEQTTSSANQPIKKVTLFVNGNASGTSPQITGYRAYDANGKLTCLATIDSVRRDPSGAVVPHKATFEWPAQKLKLKMELDDVTVNNPNTDAQRNAELFSRPTYKNIRSFDLARGTYDGPPMRIQPTGGMQR